MKRSFFLASCTGVIVGALLTATVLQTRIATAPPTPVSVRADDSRTAVGLTSTFAPVVKRVTPAVVNVSSTRIAKTSAGQDGSQMEDLFRQFFGEGSGRGNRSPQLPRERRSSGLGSGVIVSSDGYILTNNHVIDNATTVKVALSDRREFTAKIVGTDPQTDIALLKIEGKNFPTLSMADSSKAQIGDVVLAIGNPFGIGQTVTMGIVGATGRGNLGIEDYEDFIQTDAAINPGNSGGALVNANGQLIAINTAILAGNSGGNQGVGFAIPINMAREVMDQLTKTGKISRGYIGAGIQDVTPALAKAFKVPETGGTVVREVEPNSPAARAGLKPGDVVTAVDNQPITGSNSFKLRISRTAPGTVAHLKILRDGAPMDIAVTPIKRPGASAKDDNDTGSTSPAGTPTALRGLSVDNLTGDVARQLGLNPTITGVVVTDVESGSPAGEAGLREGDVIQHVNRKPVANVQEFNQVLKQSGNDPVVFLVNRGGQTQFMAVEPK
jgi:serine protease Do